ncbi:MAG: 1-acyl-sn-glycerol-3-phosphate acyltransferase, partial [Candidatus Tectomicrobia bacterium]|nr:1-acyl-sn-glycerol-3-phosphate acyltransferase [Candidatus Tectomicrobia bacterium]
PGGGVLFLCNHRSALDVLVVPWCIYTKFPQDVLRLAGKEELFRLPVVGWVLTQWRGFPVKRGRGDLSSIHKIEEYVRRDKVILYPEGTRSRDGSLGEGNRVVGRIIRNARPVVIPMSIRGAEDVVPVGKTLPRPGATVEVKFGPPLPLDEEIAIENAKESSRRIVEKAMAAIAGLLGEGEARRPAAFVPERG